MTDYNRAQQLHLINHYLKEYNTASVIQIIQILCIYICITQTYFIQLRQRPCSKTENPFKRFAVCVKICFIAAMLETTDR